MPKSKVHPIPKDMHSVTPHLVCASPAGAIEFYKRAIGAVEGARLPMYGLRMDKRTIFPTQAHRAPAR